MKLPTNKYKDKFHVRARRNKMKTKRIMQKAILTGVLGVFLMIAANGFSYCEQMKVRVIVRMANVRENPSLKSDVIGRVKRGTILQTDGKEGEWYRVRLPLKLPGYALPGYIHESIVKEVTDDVPETEFESQKELIGISFPSCSVGAGMGYSAFSERYYGGGLRFDGSFNCKLSDKFGLSLELLKFGASVEADPEGFSKGELSIIPIQLSLQWHYPLNDKISPYIFGGLGYYITSFTIDKGYSSFLEEDIKNAFGFHFGVGMDYVINIHLAFTSDARFCVVKTEGTWTKKAETPVSGKINDVNLNAFQFGIGIKYLF